MSEQTFQVIIQQDGNVVKVLSVNTHVVSIGRTPDSGLTLDHPLVSRRHAELRMGPQSLILTDLGSANGTFIGQQKLLADQPHVLTDGTTFQIGPFQLTFRISAEIKLPDEQKQPAVREEALSAIHTQFFTASGMALQEARTGKPVPRVPTDPGVGNYHRFLPDIFQENDFLRRFLMIFEDVWEPLEQRQDYIDMYFDPRTCPRSFLPWLASWLDLPVNLHWPEERIRRVLSQGMDLYRWRGTQYGLTRMIEVCTGLTPLIRESSSQAFVFHIRLKLPDDAKQRGINRDLIEYIIQMHKPAHAGYVLEITS